MASPLGYELGFKNNNIYKKTLDIPPKAMYAMAF